MALPRKRQATVRTDEATIALVRRLAVHYPDTVIAGILNRQGRKTVRGLRFEGNRVSSLRKQLEHSMLRPEGRRCGRRELLTIKRAAIALGVATSTIHRLINDGIIAGDQITPGAPWRIRLTDGLKVRFNAEAGEGFLPMGEAIRALGVSRQTVLQRVKRGELEAVHVTRGRQKGWFPSFAPPTPPRIAPRCSSASSLLREKSQPAGDELSRWQPHPRWRHDRESPRVRRHAPVRPWGMG